MSFCTARIDHATDDFRSAIFETDVLTHLVGLLQDRALYVTSRKAITTLAEFGGFLYHFLYFPRTDDAADDFRSKIVETDVLTHLIGLLQHQRKDVQWSSIIIITTLAKFGRFIYSFCTAQRLIILQRIFAPSWWKRMSLLVLFALFKTGHCTATHKYYLYMPSLPWQKSVGQYIILYCWRIHDPADDFRFKMVEKHVLSHLAGLLQDRTLRWYERSSALDSITTLAEFGGFLYHFPYCARTDYPTEEFRSQMVETDLLAWLQGQVSNVESSTEGRDVRRSSVIAITALVIFGGFLCHFDCED